MTGIGSREHLELAGNACWFAKMTVRFTWESCRLEIWLQCRLWVAM